MAHETPKYFATKKYKLWVRDQVFEKRKWKYPRFVAEIAKKGHKVTVQGLQQFLGKEDEEPVPSNTTLMPWINRVLGLPPPSHFDPTSPLSRLHAALDANWDRVPEDTQKAWALLISVRDPAAP